MTHQTLIFLFTLISTVLSVEDPIIELPTGQILGRQTTTSTNTAYYVFEKIPYATPPVGPLRFKAPQPAQPWEGVLNTTYLDTSCYQQQGEWPSDSEDCLFVNVYTPALPEEDENASFPVMLFIHGGAFTSGRSLDYRPDLLIEDEVIIVTINYRLGVFGFLSTQDEIIPGNNGLKDQRLAIQWTHENIHLFGGDPERITIFGESAGSVSVGFHLLDQTSQGLFSGAILESGSSLCPWAIQREARKIAFGTAAIRNSTFSDSDDSAALFDYLQSLDAADLDQTAQEYLQSVATLLDQDLAVLVYTPVIEVKNPDAFITRKMYGLFKAGSFLQVPIIIGINSEESLLFNPDPNVVQIVLQEFDNNLELIVPIDMPITNSDQNLEMATSIRDIYTNGEPFGANLGDGIRYASDNGFNRGIIKHAALSSSLTDVYFYQFSYDSLPGNVSVVYDGAGSVGHAEELAYLFCVTILGCSLDDFVENDVVTSQRLIKLWTNFAKYRNPTPEASDLLQNVTWPKVSLEDGGEFLYLDINVDLEVRSNPKGEAMEKWDSLYESLNFTDFDTY
ncbi:hypothetical protein Zmor_018322 [Zophobas morio]|uniref:Carboxylic ester hydrolase n=1 Tax=Zophobas morio TaxID=2755281 RepID=A0AA38IE69_9CUCU|nr:hypothetical protein Zmor_018322 [Zophobas morio]